jgi:NADPH:quinone reductase-like Zn-dependent oxidoreductase
MKAALCYEFGGPEVMQIGDIPKPEATPEQVVIEVHASSVNPIDWKIRQGQMASRFGEDFPQRLGFDVSGVVHSIGKNVTKLKVGDPVYARSNNLAGKCYAEYVAVDAAVVALKPDALSHAEAAAMPLAGLTALIGLRDVGALGKGQRVLVIGASGGVGTYAVQISKNMGAHVTAVTSSRNRELARSLGANTIIDYTREAVLGEQYDVIYDTVGSQQAAEAQQHLTADGAYLTLVPQAGVEFFVPGETVRQSGGAYFVLWTPSAQDLQVLTDWADQDSLRSVIDSEFPLEDIQQAHAHSETQRARGKIVLQIRN